MDSIVPVAPRCLRGIQESHRMRLIVERAYTVAFARGGKVELLIES